MPRQKPQVEVLPEQRKSKEELAFARLTEAVTEAVAQRIEDKHAEAERNRPQTDEELSESVLMLPWCLPRDISHAIQRLVPVWHWEKFSWCFEDNGCFKCERRDVPHQSLGMCSRCYTLHLSRVKASIVKRADGRTQRPSVGEMRAALTLQSDSARNILAEIRAIHAEPSDKPAEVHALPAPAKSKNSQRYRR